MLNIIANELRYGSEKVCLYSVVNTVGAFPIRQLYCINTRNNYFFVFYYQFGVNVYFPR